MLLLVCVCVFVGVALGVDRSKFQTCDSIGFCRRTRRASQQAEGRAVGAVRATAESLRVSAERVALELVFPQHENRVVLLELSGFSGSGVLRATMREKNALHPRFEALDALAPSLPEPAKLVYRPKPQTVSIKGGASVAIQFEPFALSVFNARGDHVMTINSRQFLNWEFYRSRPTEIQNDVDGEWDEKFGSHDDHKPRGPSAVSLDATFLGVDHVYGIPTHATNLSLPATRGEGKRYEQPFRLYNLDVFEYELDNPMALYGHVPFMIGHSAAHTTGFFWLNAAETWIDVDKSTPGKVSTHWISESGIIDMFFLPGPTPKDVLSQYASLTGPALLPPRFAIGYHQCKWNYKSEQEIEELDANFDKYNIPYDVAWLDIEHTDGKRYMTWDKTHFPEPKRMIEKIGAKGRKMVTIVDPHLKRDGGYSVHDAASKGGHYIKDRNGNEYDGWCWPGSSSWPDFLSSKVRDWWAALFDYSSYVGSTPDLMIWNDMNEPSVFNGPEVTMHKDALHHNGFEHRDVHNLYGMMVHAATHQGLLQRNGPVSDKSPRTFVLSRALFAGTQRYGAVWTGDNAAEWSHLRAAGPMVLSLGLAGVSFAGADVGGFFGNPDGELLARWLQLAAFQPFMRGHAHLDSRRREPWLFPEPFLSAQRDAIRTRYFLLPYLYTQFHDASLAGTPVVRPLWFEFPEEPELFGEELTFLLGPSLLVAPVVTAGATRVSARLPRGALWYRFTPSSLAGTPEQGGKELDAPAALEAGTPAWQRGGSVVVLAGRLRRNARAAARDAVALSVALNAQSSARGSLALDDGATRSTAAARRLFLVQDGKLHCVRDESVPVSAPFKSGLLIDRIRIAGLSRPPSSVRRGSVSFQFEWSAEGVLTVKKPQLPVDEDWTVEFD